MTDDLVKRLRAEATRKSWSAHVMSDGTTVVHPLMREAADYIERKDAALRVALEAIYPFTAPSEHYYEDFADHEILRVQLPAGWVRRARAAIAKIKEALND